MQNRGGYRDLAGLDKASGTPVKVTEIKVGGEAIDVNATNEREIVILPAPRCRRSRRILDYLKAQGIPYRRVDPETPEGKALTALYNFRASPGILVNGVSVNPFDLLIQPDCRVDEEKAQRFFTGE